MKVNISDLRLMLNNPPITYANFAYELNEALNELEELRNQDYRSRMKDQEIERLTQDVRRNHADLARITEIKDNLIHELRERDDETITFKKWFKKLHPETIEAVTFTFRKKED